MDTQKVVYLGLPEASEATIQQAASKAGCSSSFNLFRRGIDLGWIGVSDEKRHFDNTADLWRNGEPVVVRGLIEHQLLEDAESDMEKTYTLVDGLLDGEALVQLMESNGFLQRMSGRYEFIGGFSDESDYQGIEQLEFEAIEDSEVVADNIWMKASWLSFEDEDASLRFRFSWGREGLEDVAADYKKEMLTAGLAEQVFPESGLITQNPAVLESLSDISGVETPVFVERIFYFNAPNGGAQFHHDVERGHDGVIFAQLVGSTAWCALSKPRLLDAVLSFLSHDNTPTTLSAYFDEQEVRDVMQRSGDRTFWSECLNNRDSELAERLLNQIPEFFASLVEAGDAYVLNPGDIILLPQNSLEDCCWHSVFCLDDYPGEALSFAIRPAMQV